MDGVCDYWGAYFCIDLLEVDMTGAEEIRQASILVSVLLADGVITEKEAEILRQVLGPTNCEWNQDKDKIQAAIRHQGMTLIKTSNGYDLVSLGEIRAQALSLSDQQPAAWPHKWGCRANAFGKCDKGCTAPPKQPEHEPYCYHDGRNIVGKEYADHSDVFPLYTAPPKREWVGLTDEALKIALLEFDEAINHIPDATKMMKPEPVAWMYVNRDGECEQIEFGTAFDDPSVTPLYTAPPKQSEQTVSLEEYKRLQRLVTSQGIRLMEYESEQEPVACIVGMKGSAYDSPETKRAYTYEHQPHNVVAWKLGEACSNASRAQAGDYIDRCLVLLKELQAAGYGVFDLGAEYTAPPKREWVGLTEEEIANIANACRWSKGWHSDFARAIEAALKKKNNE